MALFGLVFAEQVLCAFPQSAYICALTYGAFALFRAWSARRASGAPRIAIGSLAGLGVAVALGAAAGAIIMLPLSALGGISDRAETLGYEWSTRLAYWPDNLLTFLVPYIHGDISDNTYTGPPFFWEDYGYVGVATFLLAFYGAIRERKRPVVLFVGGMTVVAYLFVLGAGDADLSRRLSAHPRPEAVPVSDQVPDRRGAGARAARGLRPDAASLRSGAAAGRRPRAFPRWLRRAICAATALDLFIHQPRQNPMVPARDWLAPPATAELVRAGTPQPRTFTPRHRDMHRRTFQLARGWADTAPYYQLRDVLAPNLGGGYWGIPSGDCYVGISPRWFVDVWGDHNREVALMAFLAAYNFDAGVLKVRPNLPAVLSGYGVTHLLSSFPVQGAELPLAGRTANAFVYRIDGAARVRFVPGARHLTDPEAAKRLLDPAFDPTREVLLADAPATAGPTVDAGDRAAGAALLRPGPPSSARPRPRSSSRLRRPWTGSCCWPTRSIRAGPRKWTGSPCRSIARTSSVRAIQLPKGSHVVRFAYEPPGVRSGLAISAAALAMLLVWLGVALYGAKRARDRLVEADGLPQSELVLRAPRRRHVAIGTRKLRRQARHMDVDRRPAPAAPLDAPGRQSSRRPRIRRCRRGPRVPLQRIVNSQITRSAAYR